MEGGRLAAGLALLEHFFRTITDAAAHDFQLFFCLGVPIVCHFVSLLVVDGSRMCPEGIFICRNKIDTCVVVERVCYDVVVF